MFVFLFLLHSIIGQPPANIFNGPTSGSIVVNEGTLTINGRLIDPHWKLSSFANALGNYDREYSQIDIYDSTGVMLWKINDDTEVTEFKAVFIVGTSNTPNWYSTNTYNEAVVIEGYTLNKNTKWDELKTALPQYNWGDNGAGWYDGVYKDIYIFVQFNETLDQLVYVAIGLDKGDNYK